MLHSVSHWPAGSSQESEENDRKVLRYLTVDMVATLVFLTVCLGAAAASPIVGLAPGFPDPPSPGWRPKPDRGVVPPHMLESRFIPGSCNLCNKLMKSVETIVKDKADEGTITSVLENTCNDLPGLVQVPCKMLIQSLIRSLVEKFDPNAVCVNLGFCSEKNLREERDFTTNIVNSTINCTACEFTVKSLQTMAEERETREFKLKLKPICDLLPGVAGMVCKGVDMLINSNEKRRDFVSTPPREFCRDAEMCARHPKSMPSPMSLNDPLCEGCEIVLSAVETMITRNDTKDTVSSELRNACSFMPGSKDECYDVMDKFGPGIVRYVASQIGKNEMCTTLGLCKG